MVSLSADGSATPAGVASLATSARKGELLSIQYLRAVAAIGVLIFHAADRTGGQFGVGGAGVDVFFVISGLIMWVISARRPPTPFEFLSRRAGRIVPLYWLVTLGLCGVWLAAPGLFPHLSPTPGHVIQSLLFLPHVDPDGVIAPLVAPGWTLNYEAFFYVVFAAALLAPGHLRALLLSAALGSLVMAGLLLRPQGAIAATYTSPLLLEFLAGVWIGKTWVAGRMPSAGVSALLLLAGVGALAAVVAIGLNVEPVRLLVWGVPGMAIVVGALGLEAAGRVPVWRAVKFLGDASYSIYLVHALAISLALKLGQMLGLTNGPTLFIAALAVGVAAGSLCYLAVERPLSRLFQPPVRRSPRPAPLA